MVVDGGQYSDAEMAIEAGDRSARFFVAVHVGAGYHSPSNEKALRYVMKRACVAAASVLSKVCQYMIALLYLQYIAEWIGKIS